MCVTVGNLSAHPAVQRGENNSRHCIPVPPSVAMSPHPVAKVDAVMGVLSMHAYFLAPRCIMASTR
jgi:hypothetical protein